MSKISHLNTTMMGKYLDVISQCLNVQYVTEFDFQNKPSQNIFYDAFFVTIPNCHLFGSFFSLF